MVEFDLYVEKCRMTMAKTNDNFIPNISFILKDHNNDTNSKPYREAIEKLLIMNEWIKKEDSWVVSDNFKEIYLINKSVTSVLPQEKLIQATKTGDFTIPLVEMGLFYKKNPTELKKIMGEETGISLIKMMLQSRINSNGLLKTEKEIKHIFDNLKRYNTQGSINHL